MAINPISHIKVIIPEVTQQDLIDRVLHIEINATPVDAPEWLAEKIQKAALDALEPCRGCAIDAELVEKMNKDLHLAIHGVLDDYRNRTNNKGYRSERKQTNQR